MDRRPKRLVDPHGEAVFVDPAGVRLLASAGLPGCSRIHGTDSSVFILVLGTPDDVAAVLWPESVEGPPSPAVDPAKVVA